MDYSQFLVMKQEIALIVAFLLVFLCDTFMPKRSQGAIGWISIIAFAAVTAFGFCPSLLEGNPDAFSGMYSAGVAEVNIKNILNIGALIVMIQALRWAKEDMVKIRRGEFYELLLVTLFGMYLMISSRHFLLFVIGLETASLPLAAMVAFDKHRYESREAAVKYILTAVFSTAIFLMGLRLYMR